MDASNEMCKNQISIGNVIHLVGGVEMKMFNLFLVAFVRFSQFEEPTRNHTNSNIFKSFRATM